MSLFVHLFGSVWNIVLLFAVAALCGLIAQAMVGHRHGGCLAAIGIGFVGAVLGIWIASLLHLPNLFSINVGGSSFPIVYALLGGMFLILILRLLRI